MLERMIHGVVLSRMQRMMNSCNVLCSTQLPFSFGMKEVAARMSMRTGSEYHLDCSESDGSRLGTSRAKTELAIDSMMIWSG